MIGICNAGPYGWAVVFEETCMRSMTAFAISLAVVAGCSKAPGPATTESAPAAAGAEAGVRLYVLDCGHIDVSNMGVFDRGGAYEGQARALADTCYLVRHAKGDLVWDAGLPDAINSSPDGVVSDVFTLNVPKTLRSQLEEIGAPAGTIEYFSISHSHFDHVGNANLFKGANFIINEAERAHMFRDEARADAQTFASYSDLEAARTTTFTDSHDVFGDGAVTILSMPGHTPGHSVLRVNLRQSGPILLTGDLYHLTPARQNRTIPTFNTDADQTLASMEKFEQLARDEGARVIIQHETADIETLPQPPAFLE